MEKPSPPSSPEEVALLIIENAILKAKTGALAETLLLCAQLPGARELIERSYRELLSRKTDNLFGAISDDAPDAASSMKRAVDLALSESPFPWPE